MEFSLYLRALRKGWWVIVVMTVVTTNISLLISYFTPPVYQTSERFIVSPNAGIFSSSWDIVSSLDTLDRRSIINTYKELLASPSIYGKNAEIQKLSEETLAKYKVSVVVIPDTNILTLTVEGPDPYTAVAVANAISLEALNYINELYPVYNFSILDTPELPTKPIRPEPAKNAALAALLGGIFGLVLALSREQLQVTIDKLRERSTIDRASSAYTRAYFERRLREEMTQHPDGNLSIGIINLRGLDEVSNVLPPPIMERLIHDVTQVLKGELRGRDIVGRWAQTQLAVLLPSTPNSAVEATFKRIQTSLSKSFSVDGSGDMVVFVDPCIGIAARVQLENTDELVRRVQLAVENASSFEEGAVVFQSKPFLFTDYDELA